MTPQEPATPSTVPEPPAPSPSIHQNLFRGLVTTVFWSAAALTGLLAFLYRMVGDRTAWGEYFTIWPPLLWGFVLVPLLVISFNRQRWRSSAWLGGAIVLFGLLTVEGRSLLRKEPSEASIRSGLRLISWNLDGCSAGYERVLEEMERHRPDVCFLQESADSPAFYETVRNLPLWRDFHYLDAGDCAILSRWSIRELPSRSVGPWSDPQLVALSHPSGGSILLVNVRLMLPSLVLVPTFSNWRRLNGDHAVRTAQFPKLARLIRDTAGQLGTDSVILAGDFNTPGGMQSLMPLEEILTDVWPRAGSGWGGTITNRFPVSRIDQCWISPAFMPASAHVYASEASDHRMLVVELLDY